MIEQRLELRTVLKSLSFLFITLVLFGYIFFQARFLIIGPVVTLHTEPAPVYNDRSIEISGTAYNISNITLNGRPVYIDEQGDFTETLVLENGYTIMTIRAEDRYGRDTTLTRSFVYRPASSINL